jgi:hypothetical protein
MAATSADVAGLRVTLNASRQGHAVPTSLHGGEFRLVSPI